MKTNGRGTEAFARKPFPQFRLKGMAPLKKEYLHQQYEQHRTDEVMIQRKKITLCTKIDKSLKMHLFCVLLTCPVMAGVSQSQGNITDSEKDV